MTIQQPPVPLNLPNQPNGTQADYVINLSSYQAGSPFDFKITRKSTNKVLYVFIQLLLIDWLDTIDYSRVLYVRLDTKLGGLTLADQFHMITFTLATTDVYGIGESTHDSFRHNLNYKMFDELIFYGRKTRLNFLFNFHISPSGGQSLHAINHQAM